MSNSTDSPFAFAFTQPKPVKPVKPQSYSAFAGSQLTATNTISGQQYPIMANSEENIEESKAIIAALIKIETISHDWRKNLTSLGISGDLGNQKEYIRYIKIYTDLIEENIEKKIHKNLGKAYYKET
jgi:hypothetical protein